MILERRTPINVKSLHEKYGPLIERYGMTESVESLMQLAELQQLYRAAMQEVNTKLEILDDEYHVRHDHNPIHHVECRLKNPRSIFEKLRKYNLPMELGAVRDNVYDIAGIRVVCNYLQDVYSVEKALVDQADIALIRRKDYIEAPKPNGYRSLHLVVSVPVFLSDGTRDVPVEIQLRTIAMDYWASLEHKLRYKGDGGGEPLISERLKECAVQLAQIEADMQQIHHEIG